MQGRSSIAVGSFAGAHNQGSNSIALGRNAAYTGQGVQCIAIGEFAGYDSQRTGAIAIGNNSGCNVQLVNSIAIGFEAGKNAQGGNSIAIGYRAGFSSQCNNSIIFNATNSALNSATANAFYIKPIRAVAGTAAGALNWNSTTGEVVQYTGKTFVIDHPTDKDKYLVHACLEGPEAGVYYRGINEIKEDDTSVEVFLPDYVKHIARDFNVIVTPIYDLDLQEDFCDEHPKITEIIKNIKNMKKQIIASNVINGEKFIVYGDKCSFNWVVYGKRHNIVVEPNKADVILKGDGPYTYLEPKQK